MSATQPQDPDDTELPTSESIAGQVPPTPDEIGPHDVPDDEVIEKTLPSTTVDPSRS
jgi:hypothetical protein